MKTLTIIFAILQLLLLSCNSEPDNVKQANSLPNIYPDYINVSIPPNIAPLNFLVRDSCLSTYVCASYNDLKIKASSSDNQVCFDIDDWKELVSAAIFVQYNDFCIHVEQDSIDPYLTYRLIEPDYEVFSRIKIEQRCIENFDTKDICNHNITDNSCMNCHTFAKNDPNTSLFYVRGANGGAILNRNKRHFAKTQHQNQRDGVRLCLWPFFQRRQIFCFFNECDYSWFPLRTRETNGSF